MTFQPIAQLPIARRFRTASGRVGTLVHLSPSSATVQYEQGAKVQSFTDRKGRRKEFTSSGLSKPTPISLATMVEELP